MHSGYLLRIYLIMELTYETQTTVTTSAFHSLLLVKFLSIPVLLGLFRDIVLVQGELCHYCR